MENSVKELIAAYEQYINVLGEEIDDSSITWYIAHQNKLAALAEGRRVIEKIKSQLNKQEIPY